MVNSLLELAGFALLVLFAWLVWPPSALLAAGLILLLIANSRANRPGTARLGAFAARFASAWLAARGGEPR